MPDYSVIYFVQMLALAAAIAMIVAARKGFNGFALGFISLGFLLIVRRIDDTTGAIGHDVMAVLSSLVVALYCYETWKVWKDRRDHDEWIHWREQWAEELKLIREWQTRMKARQEKERKLEALRDPTENLATWNNQWALSEQTRKVTRKDRANG